MKRVLIACGVAVGAWMMYAHADAPVARQDTDNVRVSVGHIYPGSAEVSVYNVSSIRYSSVFLHCTFRATDGARIDSVPVLVSDLAAGDVAKERARMPNDTLANSVSCRTEHANR